MNPVEELLQFVTSGPSLKDIVEFRPSQEARAHIQQLIEASRRRELSAEERQELDEYTRMVYIIRGLKERAQRRLSTA